MRRWYDGLGHKETGRKPPGSKEANRHRGRVDEEMAARPGTQAAPGDVLPGAERGGVFPG
jgi:hypothetical protein